MKGHLWLAIGVLSLLSACGNYDRTGDSITRGTLKVGIDESYSLMMQSQIDVFRQDYPDADIIPYYMPEGDVIEALLNDSIQAAVINRPLSEQEMAMFRNKKKIPESVKIAVDGVALIVNPQNPDTVFTEEQINLLFTGKLADWSGISGGTNRPVQIVFDNTRSCNARYISEKFLNGGTFPPNCFAVHSNDEVIEHVSTHPDALGVISVGWISDREDSTSQAFLKKIKVVAILDTANADRPEMPRKPYQAYIYDESYPLRRDVYAIRTGSRGSVGTGFVSFLYGEKGQLIIHKMGMVAAQSPVRIIRITD